MHAGRIFCYLVKTYDCANHGILYCHLPMGDWQYKGAIAPATQD
jgi:hypothetical protein